MSNAENLWVVIPAAGAGKRMLVDHPKQYLKLNEKTVIEHTIACFSKHPKIKGIVVVISKGDEYWSKLNVQSDVPLYVTDGGKERCHSVLNGLSFLTDKAKSDDWVMVHDAARPFLHADDIKKLIEQLWDHPVGGLLGLPVADTLKFCNVQLDVEKTVSRDGLWRALTPQMFRFEKLLNALRVAVEFPDKITDESSAIEMAGNKPLMVAGRWDNIKITHPQDMSQAKLILNSQEE